MAGPAVPGLRRGRDGRQALVRLLLRLLTGRCRLRTGGWLARGTGQRAVVDESDDPLGAEGIGILVGIDGEIRQRIAADRGQDSAGVLGDHLDVAVKQHPVAGHRLVTVAQRMPAMIRLRVLEDRGNAQRRRVRVDPDVGPIMQRPRVGGASGHPALLPHHLRAQLQGQAGERRARGAMIDPVDAVLLPDDLLHLGRRLALGHPEVVLGHVDDGGAEHRIVRGRGLG